VTHIEVGLPCFVEYHSGFEGNALAQVISSFFWPYMPGFSPKTSGVCERWSCSSTCLYLDTL